jgi:hypothetical protein
VKATKSPERFDRKQNTVLGVAFNAALETGGVLVGDKVKIELDIQLVRA